MKKTTVRCHLMDILAEVPDPRKAKGKRHPLRSDPRSRCRRNRQVRRVTQRSPNTDGLMINSASPLDLHTRKRLVLQRSTMCLRG